MSSSMQALYTVVSGEINGIKFQTNEALQRVLDDFTKTEEVNTPRMSQLAIHYFLINHTMLTSDLPDKLF